MSPAMRMQEVTKIIILGMCEQSADDVGRGWENSFF